MDHESKTDHLWVGGKDCITVGGLLGYWVIGWAPTSVTAVWVTGTEHRAENVKLQ